MRAVVASLLLAATGASAAPPTPAERAALMAKLATFEATAENDPKAGCNVGWIQFQLGRRVEASAALDRAIGQLRRDPARDVNVLGACLYNRGRVYEAGGELDKARADYRSSLEVRPNDTVRRRLLALGPDLIHTWRSEKAPAGAPLTEPLRVALKDSRCNDGDTPRGQRCEFDRILTASSPDGALTVSVLRQRVTHDTVDEVVLYLAVETPKGAVVHTEHPIATFVPNPPVGYHTVELAMGGHTDALGPLVLLKVKASRNEVEGGSRHLGVDVQFLVGLGAAGAPIVRAIQTVWDEMVDDDDTAGSTWSLAVALGSDGKSTVKTKHGRVPPELKPLLSKHPTRSLGVPLDEYADPLAY